MMQSGYKKHLRWVKSITNHAYFAVHHFEGEERVDVLRTVILHIQNDHRQRLHKPLLVHQGPPTKQGLYPEVPYIETGRLTNPLAKSSGEA